MLCPTNRSIQFISRVVNNISKLLVPFLSNIIEKKYRLFKWLSREKRSFRFNECNIDTAEKRRER